MVATARKHAGSSPNSSTSRPSPSAGDVVSVPRRQSVAVEAAFVARILTGEIVDNGDRTFRLATPEDREGFAQMDLRRRGEFEAFWRGIIAAHVNEAQRLWRASNVPPRYFDADLDRLGDVPKEYRGVAGELREMIRRPALNALVGKRGTGKTHLACALVREFCRHRKSARYTTAFDLFGSIKATWGGRSDGQAEAKVIGQFERTDLLVIDEVHVRAGSVWEGDQLTALIDHRYAHLKSTVVVGNLEPAGLQEDLGDSAASRMIGTGKVFVCNWGSFRKPGAEVAPAVEMSAGGDPIFPPVCPGLGVGE